MKILACDTSGRACSCCLYEAGNVRDARFLNNGLTHSQTFMPMVHELMEENQMTYPELEAQACTVGRGSFTGIRIGVSAVKTMAMAAKKPAIKVSSLEALAEPLREEDALIVPMIDGRNHRAWAAGFYHGKNVIAEMADDVSVIAELVRAWKKEDPKRASLPTVTVGNGGKMYLEEVEKQEETERDMARYAEEYAEIRSEYVAAIASRKYEAEQAAMLEKGVAEKALPASMMLRFSPRAMMPVYRAKTQAERVADEQGKAVEQVPIRYYSTMEEEK